MAGAAALGDGSGRGKHSSIRSHMPDSAFRAAKIHSARVRVLRIALPTLGVLIAIVFAGYSWLMTGSNAPFEAAEVGIVDGKLVMANPNLTGYTKENRAYRITANRAIQDFGNLERIVLEGIQASLPIENGAVAQVVADSGVFDNTVNLLTIDSPVTIVTDDGLTVILGDALIDIAAGTLRTDKQVDIDLARSQISAGSLSVEDNGDVIVFDDKVRMTLVPDDFARKDDAGRTPRD